MFDNKSRKYAKLLNLDEENYMWFIKRYTYFLKSQKKLTKKSIEAGFFILDEILIKIAKIEAEKTKYKTKNIKILKYRDEIVSLYKSGYGVIRISNTIKLNHNCDISKSAIERFIKSNNIKR